MRKIFLTVICFLLVVFVADATHNRAGEITYSCVGPLQYEVTITTYTKISGISGQADRPVLDSVHWGDGTSDSFQRVNNGGNGQDLPGLDIRVNIYKRTHTYRGSGTFDINFADPNRNADVVNIPGSVNVPFFLHTILVINRFLGACDNSPILLNPPIDRGCVGVPFIHNPNAYDPDGDSISYALTDCLQGQNDPVTGYTLPQASVSLTLNATTGDLIWDSPLASGEYNIAILIISWRYGIQMSTIERDMQIVIGNCDNHPPQITPLTDTCVLAGDTLSFDVHATDRDSNLVELTSTGGPYFVTDPAVFVQPPLGISVTGHFHWDTQCHHIRKQPYHVEFKAKDDGNGTGYQLVDLKGRNIFVIAPAPTNPVANPVGNSIALSWSPGACSNDTGYAIYRRTGLYSGTIECPCQTGVPGFTGYALLDTVSGHNHTTYTDNNHGIGLVPGNEYCYIITALYSDGAESCASPQVCSLLKKDIPVITNASVNYTDVVTGSIYVAWSRPTEIDSVQYPSPYEYRVYQSNDFFGTNPSLIATFHDLNDTTIVDTVINTFNKPWSYKVDMYYDSSGTPGYKGSTQIASSVYLKILPTDKRLILSWEEHVPWTNNRYDIFRLDTSSSLVWDSIATTAGQSYIDSGLTNGNSYCYYIRSVGSYSSSGFVNPIINFSQDTCSIPIDNVSPCAPVLHVLTDCIDEQNGLNWNNPDPTCADDVKYYKIYFNSAGNTDYTLIATINDPHTTSFVHANLTSLAGCYKVTAVDSVGNESTDALEFCVDTCREYVLPSVFTPNGDGSNDLFHPCDLTTDPDFQKKNCPPYKNVKDIDIKIFNRWGNLEFETSNKDVNWNGTNQSSGKECPDGVYYYICKVNFYRLNGTETKELHGFVHLVRE